MNDEYVSASDENQKEIEKPQLPFEKRDGGRLWIYIMLVIAGLFIATACQYYYYRDYDPHYMFAEIIGKSAGGLFSEIIIPFVISIIAKLFKKRFTNVFLATLCFIGIPLFLWSFHGAYIEYNEEKQTAKNFVERTENQFTKIIESTQEESGIAKKSKAKYKAEPKGEGILREFDLLMQDYINEFIALQNDSILELEAIGWNDLLSPKRIQEDTTFTESKFMIKRAKTIVKKYRKSSVALLMNGTEKINKMDIRPGLKKDLVDDYNDGLPSALKDAQFQFDLEEKVLLEFEKIIDLLSDNKGYWKIRNNLIYFENENDLKRFNAYLKTIKKFIREQQNNKDIRRQRIRSNFERIRKKLE